MINKIGVENFRVFKEYTEFEIRPITLLTGPNNAGKSSFTKLLLLLKNGIQKLNFHEGPHNLESFDKVLNWDKKSDILKLRFENMIPVLSDDFFVEYIYQAGIIAKITISNNEATLLEFFHKKPKTIDEADFVYIADNIQKLNFNINYFIDLIYSLQIQSESWHQVGKSQILKRSQKSFNDLKLNYGTNPDVDINNLKEKYKTAILKDFTGESASLIRDFALLNEIKKLEKNYLLYNVIANGQNITNSFEEELLKLQQQEFSNILLHNKNGSNTDLNKFGDLLEDSIPRINTIIKGKIQEYFKNLLNTESVEVNESSLGKLIFVEKLYNDEIETNQYYTSPLIEQLNKFSFGIEYNLRKLEYVSANRGSQKRVLTNKSENDIDEIVVAFSQKSDKNIDYLHRILEILEIPGELIVERFENVISVIYIKTRDRKISLSDLGYGYSQIIPIVLKMINMISFNEVINYPSEGTIIIEEPEANLHPNLQSKLADIFVTTLKFYPDLKFIIETHSEYFIRKLQFLTANKEITSESSVIYYFNADKYVSYQEPKVKKIEIRNNGNLSDAFGPGFYDETTRLQFDLMKLNQEQNN